LRFGAAAVFALAISLSACGPQEPHGGHGGHGGHFFGMPRGFGLARHALRLGMRETRPRGFRRACANDVARLCPTARTRRDQRACLEGKENSLDADCKAALTHPRTDNR
jgi:hypothetical protein